MTTSNHPPYTINLSNLCFNKYKIIKYYIKQYSNNKIALEKIGHHWYNDICLSKFISILEKKYNNILFIITGDHFSKRHIKNNPSLYEKNSVPVILYSKSIFNNFNTPKYASGNHLDLSSTILSLLLKKKNKKYSIGKSLLENSIKKLSIGNNFFISSSYIVNIRKNYCKNLFYEYEFNCSFNIQNLRKYYNFYYFLSYRENILNKKYRMGPLGFEPRTKGL